MWFQNKEREREKENAPVTAHSKLFLELIGFMANFMGTVGIGSREMEVGRGEQGRLKKRQNSRRLDKEVLERGTTSKLYVLEDEGREGSSASTRVRICSCSPGGKVISGG